MTKQIRLALAASLALMSGTALAAGEQYFLYVDGIPGTSLEQGFADYNEIESWSLGFSRGLCSGLSISKYLNASSPDFTAAALLGTFYPTAMLVGRKNGVDGAGFTYMKLTLGNVVVTAIANSGAAGGSQPSESISLQPSTVKIEIFRQTAGGATVPDALPQTVTCQKPK